MEASCAARLPDDVAEWLSAVYLLFCRSQHSVLEFGGPTLFDPPSSSSTSKYNQPVNQSWQASGLGLSDRVCLGSSELLACFPSLQVYSNSEIRISLANMRAGEASRLKRRQGGIFGIK